MTEKIQVGDTYRDRDSGKVYEVTRFNGNSVVLTKEETSLALIQSWKKEFIYQAL
ncbi:hypothetical protein ACFOLK_18860 [Marinococcus halophilus]|uniref:hypothetical protein n=1 Tax=Marinococcus halophilus TaxID=1371 RepID=UPI0036190BA6